MTECVPAGSTQSVLRTLLYLRGMMLWNIVLTSLRRLRQPRYLLGTAMALAYIWFAFIARPDRQGSRPPLPFPAEGLELIFAVALGGVVIFLWFIPDEKPGLRFSEAETAFLFPAPFTRRQLIHYKLLSGLGASLLSAFFFTLMMARTVNGWGSVLRNIGTWWILNSNISLHMIAVALVLTRYTGYGKLLEIRRYGVGALLFLYVAGVGYLVVNAQFDLMLQLFTPLRWLVRAYVSTGLDFVVSIALLLAVLALQYWWVLRLETPFEENAIALAARHAETLARIRGGKLMWSRKQTARQEPFRLRSWMPVEMILLWKQLLALPKFFRGKTFVVAAALIIASAEWLRHSAYASKGSIISAIALGFLAYLQFLLPLATRFDLSQVEQMRMWPVPGWRIVLGSMLAPIVIMSGIGWLFVLTAASMQPAVPSENMQWLTPALKWALAGGLALLIPAVTALQLIGPYGTALLFPAWALSARPGQRGFDAMGARLILAVGQLLLMMIAIVPPVIAGALGFFFSRWFTAMPGGVLVAAACAAVVLWLEALYGVNLLGERFERLDVAGELRQ